MCWPDALAGAGWEYGVPRAYVQELVAYWRDGYDWRAHEARLNEHAQFVTEIDGQRVHFIHVRSPEPDALRLICTHGWPTSVFEYLDLIGPISDPRAHGGDPGDAFDLVIPSLPGVAFSGPTTQPGWNTARIARAWVSLMRRLGYERYGAHGNDVGAQVSPEVGRNDPEHVVGVHVTQLFSFPLGDPNECARTLCCDSRMRLGARSSRVPAQRSDLNASRSSDEKISGSSHAAKWPPLSTSLK